MPPPGLASSPRVRLVALTTIGYLLSVGGAWFVVSRGVDGVADGFERAAARSDLNRAENAVFNRARALRATAVDLAEDDAIHPGAPPATSHWRRALEASSGDRITLLDSERRVAWVRSADTAPALTSGEGEALAKALTATLSAHPSVVSGLVALPHGLALVAAAPLPGGAGTLVITRSMEAEIGTISATSGLEIDLGPADAVPGVELVDEGTIRGVRTVLGVDGEPAVSLQVAHARTIHEAGTRMTRAVVIVFASLAAIFSAIVAALADRLFASALDQRASERLRAEVVEHSADGILLADPATLVVRQANPAARALLPAVAPGASLAEVTGLPADTLQARLTELDRVPRLRLGEVTVTGPAGARMLELYASRMESSTGQLLTLTARDVTERRAAEARARTLALLDTLTGLPSRALFQERLARALGEASTSGRVLAVLFLDLDGFKDVNDVLGHEVADRLLVEVGRRLQSGLRPVDLVARHGGDEFLVLLPELPNPEAAHRAAHRLLEALAEPFEVDGQPVEVGASIGVACAPTDGTDAATLIRAADLAMYKAKESGRGGWRPFETAFQERARQVTALRRALTGGPTDAVTVLYQPQVDLRTGQLVSARALAHWAELKDEALPAFAEQAGLGGVLAEWLVTRAMEDLPRFEGIRLALELPTRQPVEAVLTRLREHLAATGCAPTALELEVDDGAAEADPAVARAALERAARDGIALTLTGFGASRASFLGLRQLPVRQVRIHAALLAEADRDRIGAAMYAHLVRLGHDLGLVVGAAGVDTASQLAFARRVGVDLAQGREVGYPVTAHQLQDRLARERRAGAG